VNDSSTPAKIQVWYSAGFAGCPTGTGTCSVTSSTALAIGAATWWIQTWNGGGFGPWSAPMPFTVSLGPAFTSANNATFTVGVAGTFQITTSANPAINTITIGGVALPAGLSFTDNGDGTATLAGTPGPSTGGTYALTFTASNGVNAPVVQNFTLTVQQVPAITSANSTTFNIGAAGTFTVTTTGFPTPAITHTGTLPTGVTLVDNGDGTATLAGTPGSGTSGSYPITITAANGVNPNAVQNFTLNVTQGPAFTSANNTTFTVGQAGTFTITTTGVPPVTTIARTGDALPGGVSYTDNGDGTATLAGTPTAGTGGVYNLIFTINNGVGGNVVQNFPLTVNEAPAFTSANNVTFTVGSVGSFTVTTTGHPDAALTRGGVALPSGITFVDNGDGTGTLAGTPGAGTGGTYAITFTASNGVGGNVVQTFTLTVNQGAAFTSAASTTFTVGSAGSFSITTSGFPAIATITRGGVALPSGVTYTDNGNGTATLAGTPDPGTAGAYAITFTINNGVNGNVVQNFTLNVNEPPAITSANNTTFTVGTPGTFTVTATGFPTPTVTHTSGTLPTGVTFTSATRVLAGTATQTGAFPIQFTAANGVGANAVQPFTLNVVCPAITVTPNVMAEGLYQTAYTPVDFNQTGSTGSTFTWGATGLPAGLSIDTTTGIVSGTPTTTVAGASVVITVTDNFNCSGSVNPTLTVRPTVDNETYTGGVGGTQYVVGAAQPATPHVFVNDNVKTGDNGPAPLSVTFNAAANGTVSEGTDGTFIYTPNLNFAGPSDSFTYTLTDGNGVTNTGTVTINLSNLVWYVNNSGGDGDGRSHNPFNNLGSAATASAAGSYIYVHGAGGTTTGNLAMDANQSLVGQGNVFTLNSLTIAGGSTPTLSGTVTLANTTLVSAVNFLPTGAAMTASGVSGTIQIDQVTTNGGTNALSLTNQTGAVTVTNSSFANASGAEVLISGGNSTVSIGATIGNSGGRSVDIQNRTGGTVTFSNAITDLAQGIYLNGNTGSTFVFNGALTLQTGTSPAFTATNGGTVSNNSGAVNTITTTTGTAVNVANTNIGAGGLTFRSISVNGAVNGIVLVNTGALGGLTVTGIGGACTSAGTCSGGAIQNTTGDGISLTNTRTVSLTRVFVGTAANHGINATSVNGLTLSNSRVQDSGNADNEHGFNLINATGTIAIDATVFSGAAEDLIHLENNNTNVTLNVLNNSQFIYPTVVGGLANSAILLLPGGSSAVTASIQNSTFTNIPNLSAQISANLAASSGTQTFTFSGNTVDVSLAARSGGVFVGGQELTTTNMTITNNTFNGVGGNGVISVDTNDASTVQGTISGNVINDPPGIGMFVAVDEDGTNDIVVDNNTITNSGGDAIQTVNFGGAGVSTMQLAITNNTISGHSANTSVNFVGGLSFTGFEDNSCLVVRGNNVTGTPASATQCGGAPCVDYYIEEVGGAVTLEEVPNTGATTADAAYVNSINDAGPVTVFGVIDLTNGATCNVALMAAGGERPARRPARDLEKSAIARVLRAASRIMDGTRTPSIDARRRIETVAHLPELYVTDLADGQLGRLAGGHISIDRDAAGWGWFVDPTPHEDEEYEAGPSGSGELRAKPGGPADGRMDLLSVLLHEAGHTLGQADVDPVAHPDVVMAAKLKAGVRRRPRAK
jgi:large repetitive protein